MRILLAALLAVMTALIGAPAKAADMPDYPDIEIPDVDYGVEGAFYLRGSAAWNAQWTREHVTTGGAINAATAAGYGYSLGAGFGYETGTGLRVDGTLDYISNDGLTDGTDHLHFRSTLALANIYYDFPISGDAMGGGFGAYVGAGFGGGYYTTVVHDNATDSPVGGIPDGSGWTPAVAAMAGVSYDAGSWVGDLGYRLIYMPQLSNNAVATPSFYLNDNTLHEVRATVRYRIQ
ncbi:MAG: porin family protein [Hyphomicrobiales bacterium]|nr:MAG: porin family protein [Hyphomicrobiales bacterium]